MGWPDNHTKYGVSPKTTADGGRILIQHADSHRYKQCGNGVVAPKAEWIGRRLMEVAA
jgi:site-specific DNA-cytosine methylase